MSDPSQKISTSRSIAEDASVDEGAPRERSHADRGSALSARARKRNLTVRKIALLLHRYVGLAMTTFLVVAGLTGSILVFYRELDVALCPELYKTSSSREEGSDRAPIDPISLRERALEHIPPGASLRIVPLDTPPQEAVNFWVDLPRGREFAAHDTEYFFDPYSGELNGTRRWGDPRQGVEGLMTFILYLHYSLALGSVGEFLLGVVALLWTVDCFVGAYLTFPIEGPSRSTERAGRSWLARWKPSWLIRTNKLFAFIFTWHRASGLWLWAMFLVFAWSAVGLNLHEVYQPVMRAVYGSEKEFKLPKRETLLEHPALSFREAHARAQSLMAQETRERDIDVYSERMIRYLPKAGLYEYRVYSSRDITHRYATTSLWLDGDTGERVHFSVPTGDSLRATVTTWLMQLHFGTVTAGGLPYRIFVCFMGVVVTLLSVSGVWLWWRKRQRTAR